MDARPWHTNFSFRRRMALTAAAATVFAVALGHVPQAAAANDIVTTTIAAPFDKVAAGLTREIAAHNLVVVQKVPYQQMVKMVGVNAPPMLGFEIFHPRYGKVLYEKNPSAILQAPLRILARESDGKVILTYHKPSAVFAAYPALADLGKELDGILADIVAKAGK